MIFGLLAVGLGGRAVEFDKDVARRDGAAVGRPDGRDPAGLDRLDHLDPAGRLELALGGGDDVDAAEISPGEADRHERANDPQERHMHGRRRRLQNLQSGRKKLPVGQALSAHCGKREHAPFRALRRRRGRGLDRREDASRAGHHATSAGLV